MQQRPSQSSASSRAARSVARVSAWIVPDGKSYPIIYGLLIGGALLAAESTRRETLTEAISASSITLVLYWLAHAYSHALGDRLESGDRWTLGQLLRTAGREAALLWGAALPLVVLVVAALAGSDPGGAVLAALIATALLLVLLELIAGQQARLSGLELIIQVVVAGGLGVGVVVLKLVIH